MDSHTAGIAVSNMASQLALTSMSKISLLSGRLKTVRHAKYRDGMVELRITNTFLSKCYRLSAKTTTSANSGRFLQIRLHVERNLPVARHTTVDLESPGQSIAHHLEVSAQDLLQSRSSYHSNLFLNIYTRAQEALIFSDFFIPHHLLSSLIR